MTLLLQDIGRRAELSVAPYPPRRHGSDYLILRDGGNVGETAAVSPFYMLWLTCDVAPLGGV